MTAEEPKAVLAYESPHTTRGRWRWFAAGAVAGLIAALLAVMFVRGVRSVAAARAAAASAANATATVAVTASPPPPAAPSGFAFPQGEGNLQLTRDSIGVPYGKYIFLAKGADVVALRVTCPSGVARAISYEWLHSSNGGRDFGTDGATRGSGSALERRGTGEIKAGPFALRWSTGDDRGGWIYWPGGDGFAVAKAMADEVGHIPSMLKATGWRDREGDTLDPRTQDVKQP